MNNQSDLQLSFRTARRIHLGFMAAVLGYVMFIELLLRPSPAPGFESGTDSLRYGFYAAVVGLILILRQLRGKPGRRIPLFTAAVMTAVMCELPALFGLVYVLLTGMRRDFYFLTGISLILLLLYFPKAEFWAARGRFYGGENQ